MTAAHEAGTALCSESLAGPLKKLSPGPGRSAAEVADHQLARIHRAMVEIVAENGYEAATVRELARLARVSTRTFYQHYPGKEECFLGTHDLIVRRVLRRLISSQASGNDWRTRARLTLHAFVLGLAEDPRTARLLLVEAFAAGPAAFEQARQANRTFATSIGKSLAGAPDGIVVPPLVTEGIVAGIMSVARARLLADQMEELDGLDDQLFDWALSYRSEAAAKLAEVSSAPRMREARLRSVPSSAREREEGSAEAPTVDLTLLLSAATKLAASGEYESLTVRRILAAAGVPRRTFDAHFDCAEDCLVAALELQIDEALARAERSRASSNTWAGGLHQAISTLCPEIAKSLALADVCGGRTVGAGPTGNQCHQRLSLEISRLLTDGAPSDSQVDRLTAEACTGAILSALQWQRRPTNGRGPSVETLTYLALTPIVGADKALETICEKRGAAARQLTKLSSQVQIANRASGTARS